MTINNTSSSLKVFKGEDSPYGIMAKNVDLQSIAIPEMPGQKGDKVVTLNKTGFMKTELDPFTLKFIEYAKTLSIPVLEIGASYGPASLPALKNNSIVIANDIDEMHLAILCNNTPKEYLENLYLKPGYFPHGIDFPENSLGAVLVCRIAHFLNGEEIETGLKKIFKWLVPGGKLYFVTLSPYHHLLKDKFLPIYESRLNNGDKWPGLINNMRELNPNEAEDIPNFLHVFEEQAIKNKLLKQGYEIEELITFDYGSDPSDDRGYLGFEAVKPF